MPSLDRFKLAHRQPASGFDAALAEIRSGGKRGHWIWYVFPQLAGLGRSAMAREYAIEDIDEAGAYLKDDELRRRLIAMTNAVTEQTRAGVRLTELMGSSLDAQKLISSLTLFRAVAERLARESDDPSFQTLVELAEEILTRAHAEGYPRCEHTARQLAKESC